MARTNFQIAYICIQIKTVCIKIDVLPFQWHASSHWKKFQWLVSLKKKETAKSSHSKKETVRSSLVVHINFITKTPCPIITMKFFNSAAVLLLISTIVSHCVAAESNLIGLKPMYPPRRELFPPRHPSPPRSLSPPSPPIHPMWEL